MLKKQFIAKLALILTTVALILLLLFCFFYFDGFTRLGFGKAVSVAKIENKISTDNQKVSGLSIGTSAINADIRPGTSFKVFPAGKLWISPGRRNYKNGKLRLVIPDLMIDTVIQDSTDPVAMQKGPALYEYSQMPYEEDGSNVCIAGYRDSYGSPFLDLDKLQSGDLFYLIYDGIIYTYTYEDTAIVSNTDWSPIRTKGYSSLTLTSGDPIGTWENRIVVTARMTGRSSSDEHFFLPGTSKDELGAASGSLGQDD